MSLFRKKPEPEPSPTFVALQGVATLLDSLRPIAAFSPGQLAEYMERGPKGPTSEEELRLRLLPSKVFLTAQLEIINRAIELLGEPEAEEKRPTIA